MNKLTAIIVSLLSIPLYLLGFLFLIASGSGGSSRLLAAFGLLAVATAVLLLGRNRLRRLAEIDPTSLRTGAVELARRLGGDLTVSQLRAEYRISEKQATAALEELAAEGTAVREQREERVVYAFKGLLPSKAERLCPYCGTKLPVREALHKCPNCGANLEITRT